MGDLIKVSNSAAQGVLGDYIYIDKCIIMRLWITTFMQRQRHHVRGANWPFGPMVIFKRSLV